MTHVLRGLIIGCEWVTRHFRPNLPSFPETVPGTCWAVWPLDQTVCELGPPTTFRCSVAPPPLISTVAVGYPDEGVVPHSTAKLVPLSSEARVPYWPVGTVWCRSQVINSRHRSSSSRRNSVLTPELQVKIKSGCETLWPTKTNKTQLVSFAQRLYQL